MRVDHDASVERHNAYPKLGPSTPIDFGHCVIEPKASRFKACEDRFGAPAIYDLQPTDAKPPVSPTGNQQFVSRSMSRSPMRDFVHQHDRRVEADPRWFQWDCGCPTAIVGGDHETDAGVDGDLQVHRVTVVLARCRHPMVAGRESEFRRRS
jgi:hypothetical protein